MSNTWIYQKKYALAFTDSLNLKSKEIKKPYFIQDYKIQRNLFDEDDNLERSICISELDTKIKDDFDFADFDDNLRNVKRLVIINDRPKNDSVIYSDFSNQMLKAFILEFESKGFECYFMEQ